MSGSFSTYMSGTRMFDGEVVPTNYSLEQNYPNPFNPTTIIPFDLSKGTYVKLVLVNILGNTVNRLIFYSNFFQQFQTDNTVIQKWYEYLSFHRIRRTLL